MALIFTTKGDIEESLLRKVEGVVDNDNEHTEWVEHYLGDELVKRSVHVHLKKGLDLSSEAGGF